MTEEQIKDCLCLYDDVCTWRTLENMTGQSIDYLRFLYNELFDNGELLTRKEKLQNNLMKYGVYRIDPLDGDVKIYEKSSDITADGFNTSNVFCCCRSLNGISKGYLWRFGSSIDPDNVLDSVKKQVPWYFRPVECVSEDGEITEYDSVLQAELVYGFRKQDILDVIFGEKKSYRDCIWRFSDGG